MNFFLRLAGLAAFLFFAPQIFAADLSGTWKGVFDFQGTGVPMTMHLTVSGAALTGTIIRPEAPAADIHEGKVDGDAVTFWINVDYEGTAYKLVFKGKAAADQIEFIFGTEDGSWGTSATMKRATEGAAKPAVDANGTWKGAFDFQGTSVPLIFHLKTANGALTGTVEGMSSGAAEIKDGVLDGENLRFTLMTEYEGSPVKLVYKGKLAATEIKFIFGTEDGSWGAELIAGKV
jgi:hypothetical protein